MILLFVYYGITACAGPGGCHCRWFCPNLSDAGVDVKCGVGLGACWTEAANPDPSKPRPGGFFAFSAAWLAAPCYATVRPPICVLHPNFGPCLRSGTFWDLSPTLRRGTVDELVGFLRVGTG